MNSKTLSNLIKKIENVVGQCEYDEDEIDEVSDTFKKVLGSILSKIP